jgi:hypothetical protein
MTELKNHIYAENINQLAIGTNVKNDLSWSITLAGIAAP